MITYEWTVCPSTSILCSSIRPIKRDTIKVVPGTWQLDCACWGNVMFTNESRFALEPDDMRYRTDLLIFKRGSVTTVRYRDEVLETIVRLYSAAVGPTFVLMDDNARPHRADIVDDYLESEGIARMAWPAYSSDLNPIEIIWDALGRAISSRFPPPVTLIELKTALQEEWRLLNSAVVDHLIESMVRRYKLYIQMRRDRIPY
ncbi:transposable element Tcb1 transposase [Trichonephila clavipes]|nr:transposable element Tcb1 transposase [Trichonephila clavipes]